MALTLWMFYKALRGRMTMRRAIATAVVLVAIEAFLLCNRQALTM